MTIDDSLQHPWIKVIIVLHSHGKLKNQHCLQALQNGRHAVTDDIIQTFTIHPPPGD